MPNTYLTMLDVAKINGSDAVVGLIEENINVAPELTIFPVRTIAGTSFKTLHRTALPTPGFRAVNEGVNTQRSEYTNKLVECFYLDGKLEMDVAAASADENGTAHALTMEADGMMQGAVQTLGRQVWYGTANDAKGFLGAQTMVDSAYVLDAGGTTADTGSSVYGVRVGTKYATMVFGKETVLSMDDWRVQRITRNSKELDAHLSAIQGWVGMQWVNKDSVCRLKDATADATKGVTDAKLAELMAMLKWVPDYWFMTRRSRFQLQLARAAGSNTSGNSGTPVGALPTESNGIPIIVTDSLTNTEALS